MGEIKILSFAKINLSIDVDGLLPAGMHNVDMVMHQTAFHDDVTVRFTEEKERKPGDIIIKVKTNRYYLPTDQRNLAYKAALLMRGEYGKNVCGGSIEIKIHKRIPVAAGLAGGSGNGAAVLHGLNVLWGLRLDLADLCRLGERLGSDVPFCVMGQARSNYILPDQIRRHKLAASCARATGTGTDLIPLPAVNKHLIIAKPTMGVSTREVYREIDNCVISERPDNDELMRGIRERDFHVIYSNCINVLEAYTLNAYKGVKELKLLIERETPAEKTLMSGSGPTVFAMYPCREEAKAASENLRRRGYESYWTKTTI